MRKARKNKDMKRAVKKIVVGLLEANCYIFADMDAKIAAIIDPGGDGDNIKSEVEKLGVKIKCVINTHGHGDHIFSNKEFNAPICIHKLDAEFLKNPQLNLSSLFGFAIKSPPAGRLLEEGDIIEIGSLRLKVIHTPGHTPGSISLLGDQIVFTGDTLFKESIGRTDFSYGSGEELIKSIKYKLLTLGDNTLVFPGHGPSTTIGEEKKRNPFININELK